MGLELALVVALLVTLTIGFALLWIRPARSDIFHIAVYASLAYILISLILV